MPATLQDKLRAKRFVITAEVTPPVSADRGEFLAKALPLKGLADAVNVTDGAGNSTAVLNRNSSLYESLSPVGTAG